MSPEDTAYAAVLENLKILWGDVDHLKPFNFAEVKKLFGDVVRAVENVGPTVGALTGPQKKSVAVRILNRWINIPLVPEFAEAWVISWGIDFVIGTLNRWFGKQWVSKMLAVPAN